VGIIAWIATQTFAHWIRPYVRSNAFTRFVTAHDVIVGVSLPERLAEQSLPLESSCLFEASGEENHVGCVERARDQNVEVIRHKAPSMKLK
jgi:hypothetical protein